MPICQMSSSVARRPVVSAVRQRAAVVLRQIIQTNRDANELKDRDDHSRLLNANRREAGDRVAIDVAMDAKDRAHSSAAVPSLPDAKSAEQERRELDIRDRSLAMWLYKRLMSADVLVGTYGRAADGARITRIRLQPSPLSLIRVRKPHRSSQPLQQAVIGTDIGHVSGPHCLLSTYEPMWLTALSVDLARDTEDSSTLALFRTETLWHGRLEGVHEAQGPCVFAPVEPFNAAESFGRLAWKELAERCAEHDVAQRRDAQNRLYDGRYFQARASDTESESDGGVIDLTGDR